VAWYGNAKGRVRTCKGQRIPIERVRETIEMGFKRELVWKSVSVWELGLLGGLWEEVGEGSDGGCMGRKVGGGVKAM